MVVLGCLLANPEYSGLSNDSEEVEHDWSEQSSVARLVNAMASLRRGRNYLGECEAINNLTLPRNVEDLHFIQLNQKHRGEELPENCLILALYINHHHSSYSTCTCRVKICNSFTM